MGRFNEFVKSSGPLSPSLPLFHTCEGYSFRGIVESKQLHTAPCKFFNGENLLFMFYGRPSYRLEDIAKGEETKATKLSFFFPVCIMVKPDSVPTPKRIAPFDTGAFKRKLFAEHMHPKMNCNDFLLDPTLDMPNRLASRFYGSNQSYFNGVPLSIEIPPIEFEAISYFNLINSDASGEYDDRNATVEIQSESNLILDSNAVLLIVMPTIYWQDMEFGKAIRAAWHTDVRTYSIHRGHPNEYVQLIYREVEEYLKEKSYL